MRFGNCESVADVREAIRDNLRSADLPTEIRILLSTEDPFVWDGYSGGRPGPSFEGSWSEKKLVATDGHVEEAVTDRDYNYPTDDTTYYRWTVSGWSFIVRRSHDDCEWDQGNAYQAWEIIVKDEATAKNLKAVVAEFERTSSAELKAEVKVKSGEVLSRQVEEAKKKVEEAFRLAREEMGEAEAWKVRDILRRVLVCPLCLHRAECGEPAVEGSEAVFYPPCPFHEDEEEEVEAAYSTGKWL